MRLTIAPLSVLLSFVVAAVSTAQDMAILKVEGRGVEGRPAYGGGGVLEFTGLSVDAQVVHFNPEKGAALPLVVDYNVIEPAPILLTSRMGTEHWQLYHFASEGMSAMYADQKIDLSKPGKHSARASRAWFGKSYGPLPGAGLVGIRGHRYFLIDQDDGKWLDVADPPNFFNQSAVQRDLTFTLADLTKYELMVDEVQSTWQPDGPLRVRVVIRDAQKRALPVVGAPIAATAGSWRARFGTEWTPLGEPTGWMRTVLPEVVPARLTVAGDVALQTSDGLKVDQVAADFPRGTGLVSQDQLTMAEQGYKLPRDRNGAIRETRAVWASNSDIASADSIDRLVTRCTRARLNVIVPSIFVRNDFYAESDLIPITGRVEQSFDPLEDLIAKAHATGLEVHPWFCVTYRDRHFRTWFADEYGRNIDMIDPKGEVISLGADVHRPEYRRFIVDLMVGVARDYDVDGIHHDYIRTMNRCYCSACQKEFADAHAGQLADATDEQWLRWQRSAVGDIVERTAGGVRKVRPNAALSAAVFANMPSGASQGQDPAGWADRGWLDLVIPMDYQMQTLQVRSNERRFLDAMSDDDQLATGLSLYMRSAGQVSSRPPKLLLEQIELVRSMGIHGYCLFAFGHMSDEQLEVLREQANAEPARPFFR